MKKDWKMYVFEKNFFRWSPRSWLNLIAAAILSENKAARPLQHDWQPRCKPTTDRNCFSMCQCVPASSTMLVEDLPNNSWCTYSHVENEWGEGHGSDLEGQDSDNMSCDSFIHCFLWRVVEEIKKKNITFEQNIQTPKCSIDRPLFSLTVASSNMKPSNALWREEGRFYKQINPTQRGLVAQSDM